jgi:hypothetical protein
VQQSALKPKSAFGNYKMAEAQNQAKVQKAPEKDSGEEPGPKQTDNQYQNIQNNLKLS